MSADAGEYALQGGNSNSITNTPFRTLLANASTFVVTGVAAILNKTTISGSPYSVAAAKGTYVVTGQAANLTRLTPVVLFTDAVSGPTSGGENGLGCYLSIFGTGFGTTGLGSLVRVYIGGFEVANYRYLGPSKTYTKTGIQQITVQVGALGSSTQGVAIPVIVQVGGINSNSTVTFTPNPGRVLFVSLSGNDATAAVNDITKPWRNLQTAARGGAYATMRAGDHVVIRGGSWSDTGFETGWLRFRDTTAQGSVPTGSSGTGWIHFTAYPGPISGNAIETVSYTTPASSKGGFQGPGSAYAGTTGEYVSISNLVMGSSANASSDAAPCNLQSSFGHWRVVNNELGPWPSAINSKGGGVAGHGDGVKVLGNYIHDMACTGALENHGVYVDSGGSNWEIAYNHIYNITGGNLIQFFDNSGLIGNNYSGFPAGWVGFQGMSVHNNYCDGSGKYGLNFADSTRSVQCYNNVVINSTFAGLRINVGYMTAYTMDVDIAHNTFWNNDRVSSGSGNAQVLNTWNSGTNTGTWKINNNIFMGGPNTVSASTAYANSGGTDTYLTMQRNLWYRASPAMAAPSRDSAPLTGDPLFTNASAGDFSLQTGSPAINTATAPVDFAVAFDYFGVSRPQGGVADIGAMEKA